MDPWWRRRGFFGDDFFKEIEEEFREMEERMSKIFDEISEIPPEMFEKGPYIYGFSIRTGPEGKPIINEFGNIPKRFGEIGISEREPLVDIIEGDDKLTIVAELPGVEKKDINLEVEQDTLIIDVDAKERRYHKKLKLPCGVRTDDVKATYKNGILEVKLKRLEKKREKRRINIM